MNVLDGRKQERNNRTPHPTDMEYAVVERPQVNIIENRRSADDRTSCFENCPDFHQGWRKTHSQYV